MQVLYELCRGMVDGLHGPRVVLDSSSGGVGSPVGLVSDAVCRAASANLDPRGPMALDGTSNLLPYLLPLRARVHASVVSIVHAVGVLSLCLHGVSLLLLWLLSKLARGQGAAAISTRLRATTTCEALSIAQVRGQCINLHS